jgi:hypothetical protein
MQRETISGLLLRSLLVASFIAAVLFFFYTFENWRGEWAWRKFTREMQARGERLDWTAFLPKPVPDEQNFLGTPVLAAIAYKDETNPTVWSKFQKCSLSSYSFDCSVWKQGKPVDLERVQDFLRPGRDDADQREPRRAAREILESLMGLRPQFLELRQASQRPFAQFPGDPDPNQRLPNFVKLRSLSYLLALKTSAELALGQHEEAYADAVVLQRLSVALQAEPHLVGMMVGCAILGNMELQVFWEGLMSGQWSEAELQRFQAYFGSVDLLGQFDRAMRGGERAGLNEMIERTRQKGLPELFGLSGRTPGLAGWVERIYYRSWPRGWTYQNQVFHNRLIQEVALSNYDLPSQRVYPRKCRENAQLLFRALNSWSPFSKVAAVGTPNILKALQVVAQTQTAANEARLACALERYRRTQGKYPAHLDELVPEFLDKLPHDLITGQPLHYKRAAPDKFLLYSNGWDETDDGGIPDWTANSSGSSASGHRSGDWVWPTAEH